VIRLRRDRERIKLTELIDQECVSYVNEASEVADALRKLVKGNLIALLIRKVNNYKISGLITQISPLNTLSKFTLPLKRFLTSPISIIKVKSYRTKVYTTDTLIKLLTYIRRHKLATVVPLYATANEIMGVVTYRKIYEYLRKLTDLTPIITSLSSKKYPELMVSPNTMAKTVIRKLARYGSYPVIVHRKGKVLGVVRPLDLLRQFLEEDVLNMIDKGIDEYFLNAPITVFASRDYPSSTLEGFRVDEVHRALLSHGYILTLSSNRLAGLITIRNVIVEYFKGLSI